MAKAQLKADIVTIFLHAPKTKKLWSRWGTNLPSDIASGRTRPIRVPAHAGIAGRSFTKAELVNVPDAYSTPFFNRNVDAATGYVTRSVLALPLSV